MASIASVLPTEDEVAKAGAEELRRMIADYQNNMQLKDQQILALAAEKDQISADFAAQLANVRDEFARMSEIAVKEQEELNERISDLEHELEEQKASGATVTAGAAVEQKKKMEAIQAECDAKLAKNDIKLQKITKQLESMKASTGDQASELAEMTAQVAALQKENIVLQKKAEKFAEAAAEAVTLKEKLTLVKQQLKECTAEFDQVSTKYKEEQTKRKKLLNELEDLKGKVRVYCRIRPFSKTELKDPAKNIQCYTKTDEMSLTVGSVRNRTKDYNFDAVFDQDSTQD